MGLPIIFATVRKKRKNLIVGVLGCMAERVKNELIEKHHNTILFYSSIRRRFSDAMACRSASEKPIRSSSKMKF